MASGDAKQIQVSYLSYCQNFLYILKSFTCQESRGASSYKFSPPSLMHCTDKQVKELWLSIPTSHFFSYAFASLLFLSTLLSLSHASIEQPSSVKCPIPASLEPNS